MNVPPTSGPYGRPHQPNPTPRQPVSGQMPTWQPPAERYLAQSPPPSPRQGPAKPDKHGGEGDPRYPSPRRLRRCLSFTVDLLIALGIGVGAFFAGLRVPALATYPTLDGVAALIIWSFVHRTIIQWAFGATVGKALFGLVLIRRTDGGRPAFGMLLKAWFIQSVVGISAIGELAGNSSGLDYKAGSFPVVVRACDVRALRRGQAPAR